MNNKEYIAEMALRSGYDQKTTQKLVNTVINEMSDAFVNDNAVNIPNFGTFETKKKMERIMVNPSTGQRMLVPPKLVLNFKPAQNWKEQLKQ